MKLRFLDLRVLVFICFYEIVLPYTIKCDKRGACVMQVSNFYDFYVRPGSNPVIYEKNAVPLKNTTILQEYMATFKKKEGYSLLGLLPESKNYECSGGLGECIGGCCKNGLCTDPYNICVTYDNSIRLVYLIIGFFFLLLFLLYWITFYVFGIFYNSNPKISKNDSYKKSTLKQENESNKIFTPNNLGSTDKLEENKNLIGTNDHQVVADSNSHKVPQSEQLYNKGIELERNQNIDSPHQILPVSETQPGPIKTFNPNQEKNDEQKKNFFNWMFN